MHNRKRRTAKAMFAATTALVMGAGVAMAFPERPITFVAPYNPGGTVDPTARITAAAMSEILGQPVVVENRAGAAGTVGTDYVVRSAGDGYTVLIHTNVVTSEACLKSDLPYDFSTEMVSVANLVETPFAILVNPDVPANTLDELVEYARANPGELLYGSAGVGSSGHLRGEQFKVAQGVEMDFIPYQGGADNLLALAGGEIQVAFDTLVGSVAMLADGRVRALSVSTAERWSTQPDVLTMAEQGFESLENQWIGAFVPAGTPADRIAILEAAFAEALQREDVIEQFARINFAVVSEGAQETGARLVEETAMWCDVIGRAGISLD